VIDKKALQMGVASLPESKSWGLCLLMCKMQGSKYYVEFLPLVLKDKKKRLLTRLKSSLYSCLLTVCLPSGSRTLNRHLETIYRLGLDCRKTLLHLVA